MTPDTPMTSSRLREMREDWQIPEGSAIVFPGKVTPEVAAFLQSLWTRITGMHNDLHRCISEIERLHRAVAVKDDALLKARDLLALAGGQATMAAWIERYQEGFFKCSNAFSYLGQ